LQQQPGEMFKGVIGVTNREQAAGHSQRSVEGERAVR
jgi:hypothetical protein